MFRKIKDKLAVTVAKSFLSSYQTEELNAGKRFFSVIAGVYILQNGIKNISTSPIYSIQKVILGSVLLFNAASDLNRKITRKPTELSDIRKNQIQGNDPKSSEPAFV